MARAPRGTDFVKPQGDAVGPVWSFVGPNPTNTGVSFGFNLKTGGPFYYDPADLMARGIIESKVEAKYAKKNHGKTATSKIEMMRFGNLSVGGDEFSVAGDDVRKHQGEPEYARWVREMYGCNEIDLSKGFNPFDADFGMAAHEYQGIAISTYDQANFGVPLVRHQQFVLMIAVRKMFSETYRRWASIPLLTELLRTFDPAMDVVTFQSDLNGRLATQLGVDSSAMPPELRALSAQSSLLKTAELAEDAFLLYERFTRLLEGDFGIRFGTTRSLADEMSQRAAFVNYVGLSEADIAFAQSILWTVKRSAIARGDQRFIKKFENHDENSKLWNYLPYAEGMANFLKEIRSVDTIVNLNTHRFRDYESVDHPGSRQRQLATNMRGDVSVFWYGKLSKRDVEEAADYHGNWSNRDVNTIRILKPGQWAVQIGDEDLEFIQLWRTEMEKEYTESNAANERALQQA